jgi:signal transduction histidine kinase
MPVSATASDHLVGVRGSARPIPAPLDDELLHVIVVAEDFRAGIAEVFARLRRTGTVAGAEWWTPSADGSSLRLELSAGSAAGVRTPIPIGVAGTLVLVGGSAAGLEPAIARLGPLLQQRWMVERLAEHAAQLARKNEALEDFAGLVAHDVRSSLVSALTSDAPRESLMRALELVDSILEAVRADSADSAEGADSADSADSADGADGVATADSVRQAVADLGDIDAEVITRVTGDFPIAPAVLRLVLRNLLANAVAAGARRIYVSALAQGDRRALVVDDDGVGLGSSGGYTSGTQLGLLLCRRLVARCGGVLELKPRAVRGTRAQIVLTGASG